MRASDQAYLALREQIIDGSLAAGSVLAEVEQSRRLGVSRTPLREALARLVGDGLVSSHTGRGLVVTAVTTNRIRELFEVRQPLEEQAARLAARRRDRSVFESLQAEFRGVEVLLATDDPARHRYYELVGRLDATIDAAAGNPLLVATLNGVRTHVARIRRMSSDNPQRLREAAREHLLIVDAIVDGEETIAATATALHLYRSLTNILESIETEPTREATP